MSAQNHYETLGVDESSSFEEIQDARDRLLKENSANRKQAEAIEAAYDSILMERLRMRQEGKIKVPDRIRFAEKLAEAPSQSAEKTVKQAPAWLKRFIDNPSRNEVLWPALVFSVSALLSIQYPSVGLAVGIVAALFFLNRKENRFIRAVFMTLAALFVGTILGYQLGQMMGGQLGTLGVGVDAFAAMITAFLFWLVSSFLR